MSAGLPHPLGVELVELISDRMRLYAAPTRIRILDEVRDGERTVQAIADAVGATQQNVSGHLRLLHEARVVSRRVEGRQVYYSVADETVFEVWERVVSGLRSRRG